MPGPRRLPASLPSRLPAENMAALSCARWLTRVRPGSRSRGGGLGFGGVLLGSLQNSTPYLTGLCVSVAGAGRRPDPRGMEGPVHLRCCARHLARPGKSKAPRVSTITPTPSPEPLPPPPTPTPRPDSCSQSSSSSDGPGRRPRT